MIINLFSISKKISLLGFTLLFPGFFLYHYLISYNVISPIFGGLFGFVSLIIGSLSIIFVPWIIKSKLGDQIFGGLFFYFSCIYFALYSLGGYFFFNTPPYSKVAFDETISTMIVWLCMFFIGLFINLGSDKFRTIIQVSWFVCLGLAIHSVILKGNIFSLYMIFQNNEEGIAISSYQQIGRSILITTLFLISTLNSHNKIILVYLISLLMLLAAGSRTDFTSLFIVFILSFSKIITNKTTVTKKIFVVVFGFIIVLGINFLIVGSRISELLDLSNSTSWQGRGELTLIAIDVIKKNPLWGSFDYYIMAGGYAHNILSSWASFGIFGFLFFLGCLAYFFYLICKGYFLQNKQNPYWQLAYHINVIVIVQAIFTTPIFSVLPALAWGVVVNLESNKIN